MVVKERSPTTPLAAVRPTSALAGPLRPTSALAGPLRPTSPQAGPGTQAGLITETTWGTLPSADLLHILALLFAPPEGIPLCDLVPLARQFAAIVQVCRWWRQHADATPLCISVDNPTGTQMEWLAHRRLEDVHIRTTRQSALDTLLPALALPSGAHVAACLSRLDIHLAHINAGPSLRRLDLTPSGCLRVPSLAVYAPLLEIKAADVFSKCRRLEAAQLFVQLSDGLAGVAQFLDDLADAFLSSEASASRGPCQCESATVDVNEPSLVFESPFAWPFHPVSGRGVRLERFGILEFHRLQEANFERMGVVWNVGVPEGNGAVSSLSLIRRQVGAGISCINARWADRPTPYSLLLLPSAQQEVMARTALASSIHCTIAASRDVADVLACPRFSARNAGCLREVDIIPLPPELSLSPYSRLERLSAVFLGPPVYPLPACLRILLLYGDGSDPRLHFPSDITSHMTRLEGLELYGFRTADLRFVGTPWSLEVDWVVRLACRALISLSAVEFCFQGSTCEDFVQQLSDSHCEELMVECAAIDTGEVFETDKMFEALASPLAIRTWQLIDGRNENTWLFRLVRKGPPVAAPLLAGGPRTGPSGSCCPLKEQCLHTSVSRAIHRDHNHTLEEHLQSRHHSHRAPWLRAFVLGASDGLVSTAALLTGVAGAHMEYDTMVLTGAADIEIERQAHEGGPEAQARELDELTGRSSAGWVPPHLARQVAVALTEHDALRAHARDELGELHSQAQAAVGWCMFAASIVPTATRVSEGAHSASGAAGIDMDDLARPLQAAVVSAITFAAGGGLPLAAATLVADPDAQTAAVVGVTTLGLAGFGMLSARLGGASMLKGAGRVALGGLTAMAITFGVGSLFDVPMA
eukprot:scaffold15.g4363.t1